MTRNDAEHFQTARTSEFVGHKKKVHSVAWSCTGRKLASGSVDQTARVWVLDQTGFRSEHKSELELKGHSDSVDQVTWDPKNENQLATASADKSIRIWDTRSGKSVAVVPTQGENINISWSPNAQTIAVGSRDDIITFIDTRKFKILSEPVPFAFEVNEIAWNKAGTEFFLTTGLGTIEVLKYPGLEAKQTLYAHTAGCYCIAFDPTGKHYAVGSADALVSIWDVEQNICVNTLTRLDWPVRTLSFSMEGKYIASASEDLVIDIADVETGDCAYKIACRSAMNSVAWNPCHMLLAYAGDDRDLQNQNTYGSSRSSEGTIRVFGF